MMKVPEILELLRNEGVYDYPTCPNEARHSKAETSTMCLKERTERDNGNYRWHCGKRTGRDTKCNTSITIREGLPFDCSNIPLNQLVAGVCKFLDNVEFQIMVKDLGWMPNTVYNLTRKCKRICVLAEEAEDQVVGGPKMVVDYDETIIGRRGNGHWVVGVYERESGRLLMELVPGRAKPTLEFIIDYIKKHVRVGSTVMTDCMMFGIVDENLDAGNPLMKRPKVVEMRTDLLLAGYDHIVVDHPKSGANTRGIDSHWGWLKKSFPQSPSAKYLASYIAKHLFIRRARMAHRDPTLAFFDAWKRLYESGYTIDQLKRDTGDGDEEEAMEAE